MNDLHHPCKRWAEPISLAASGCLSSDEEREVRRHIETCSGCQEQLRQLTELCGTLSKLQVPADDAKSAIVERVMSAVASDDPEIIHPNFLTRSLDNWRCIMRSPVSRVTAAAIFVCAVVGTMLWFHGPGATPTFADVAQKILEMKSAKFLSTAKGGGVIGPERRPRDGVQTTWMKFDVFWSAPGLYRRECIIDGHVRIWDYTKQKSCTLESSGEWVSVTEYLHSDQQGIIEKTQEILRKAKSDPEVESLGKKVIDGHNVIGYRVKEDAKAYGAPEEHHPFQIDVWADSKTLWPVRIERSITFPDGYISTLVMSKFEYNVKMDKSLFNTEPPTDDEVFHILKNGSQGTEKDLIEMLREFSKLNKGHFPESSDWSFRWSSLLSNKFPPGKWTKRRSRANSEMNITFYRGSTFFHGLLPPETDARYAGKGVSFGEAEKPIAWYRPKDAKKYRVIYGDLSVKEVTPGEIKKFPKGEVNGYRKREKHRKAEMGTMQMTPVPPKEEAK